jgi:hypothetical protein
MAQGRRGDVRVRAAAAAAQREKAIPPVSVSLPSGRIR